MQPKDDEKADEGARERAAILWRSYLTGDHSRLDAQTKLIRRIFKRLPSPPRCLVCNAPFHGLGGHVVGLFGFRAGRSSLNPRLCDNCEILVKRYQVGGELELTMLFADVRGSTTLAEEIGASAFHQLINRFYTASTDILIRTNALIDKLVGDEVIGLYVPGIAGPQHARVAVDAARELLKATGHAGPGAPWIPVGAGVHTGTAYVGAVGSNQSVSDITVLGDAANTAARLASQAAAGEILVSTETCRAAGLNLEQCETRQLHLKGRTQPVTVRVIRTMEESGVSA